MKSCFTKSLVRALKNSTRFMCTTDDNGGVYVTNGYFAVRLTVEEYDQFVRPVTMRDPGNWHIDQYGMDRPGTIDLVKTMEDADASATHAMSAAPMVFEFPKKRGKDRFSVYYSESGDFVAAFNPEYTSIVCGGLECKGKDSVSPMVFRNHFGDVVALVLPCLVQKPELDRSVRAWFVSGPHGLSLSSPEENAQAEDENPDMPDAEQSVNEPDNADVAEETYKAVHDPNLAAETDRLAAEKEKEQKEREAVLAAQNDGHAYIESVAAAHPIQEGAPVVTIQWSEHPAFYSWDDGELKLSVSAAEIILRHFDEKRAEKNAAEGRGGYDKTKFVIEYTADDGERHTYDGRYDLGDNDGGLIAHIRAFSESKRKPGYFHDEQAAAEIMALADVLEAHTADGRVVSVSLAPWFEDAVRERQNAADEARREAVKDVMDAVEMLTDDQLAAAVLQSPKDTPDVSRFFLQALARRDEKKALSVFRAWRSGAGLEFLDEI